MVSGADLSLDLAEQLLTLAPFGQGNPDVRLYLAGATFDAVRTMGDSGQHVRFNVNSGGVRASAVAFGCDGRVPGADGTPVDASFKLERQPSGTAWSSHGSFCSMRPRAGRQTSSYSASLRTTFPRRSWNSDPRARRSDSAVDTGSRPARASPSDAVRL